MILNAGHRIIFRAPYYPVDGPIEYVFNTIQQGLTKALYRVYNLQQLMDEFGTLVAGIDDFSNYFIGYGY